MTNEPSTTKRVAGRILSIGIVVYTLIVGMICLRSVNTNPRTDDAEVEVIRASGHIFVMSKGRELERTDHLHEDLPRRDAARYYIRRVLRLDGAQRSVCRERMEKGHSMESTHKANACARAIEDLWSAAGHGRLDSKH